MSLKSLARANVEQLRELEQILGYTFADSRLLQKALVHSSFAFERSRSAEDNEILEFLGDAVLDLIVGQLLIHRYPRLREGELTRLRASLVNEQHLATMAREIELGRFLLLGKGEEATSGRDKPSILSCAYEAVVGAIFEDGGFDAAHGLVRRFFEPVIATARERLQVSDAKSRLQEVLQERYNEAPSYSLEHEEGPAHCRVFTTAVLFRGQTLATGTARSKKEGEQKAAAAALDDLEALLARHPET